MSEPKTTRPGWWRWGQWVLSTLVVLVAGLFTFLVMLIDVAWSGDGCSGLPECAETSASGFRVGVGVLVGSFGSALVLAIGRRRSSLMYLALLGYLAAAMLEQSAVDRALR